MASEQFMKLLGRHDPVAGGLVAPAHLPHKRGSTTSGGVMKFWPRIRVRFNVRTRRRAKRLLRLGWRVSALCAFGYLAYLGVVEDNRATEHDKQQITITADSPHDAIPVPEQRSVYSLTSKPPDLATGQPTESPSLSPNGNARSASDSRYAVQISAERSDAEAQASFKTLQSRYPDMLAGRQSQIRRIDLGSKGVVYRAQIGPFDTVEQAKQFCGRLKAAGGHCIVQKNS
jgi:cell division protein FtsN